VLNFGSCGNRQSRIHHRASAAAATAAPEHGGVTELRYTKRGAQGRRIIPIVRICAETIEVLHGQARIVEGVLQQGIREGTVAKINTRKASFAITDLTRGIAIQRVLGWSKTRLHEEVDFLFNLIWKGIGK